MSQEHSTSNEPRAEQEQSRARKLTIGGGAHLQTPPRRRAAARRRDAGGQAGRDASWRPRDPGGVTQAVGRRRHDAGDGDGVTQAAVAARLEQSSGGLCLRGAQKWLLYS